MVKKTYTYPKSIRQAALLLDKANPGWEKKIDISRIDMNDYSYCILGQLYNTYKDGFQFLFSDSTNSANANDCVFGSNANIAKWQLEINKRLTRPVSALGGAVKRNQKQVKVDNDQKNIIRAAIVLLEQGMQDAALVLLNKIVK